MENQYTQSQIKRIEEVYNNFCHLRDTFNEDRYFMTIPEQEYKLKYIKEQIEIYTMLLNNAKIIEAPNDRVGIGSIVYIEKYYPEWNKTIHQLIEIWSKKPEYLFEENIIMVEEGYEKYLHTSFLDSRRDKAQKVFKQDCSIDLDIIKALIGKREEDAFCFIDQNDFRRKKHYGKILKIYNENLYGLDKYENKILVKTAK